MNSSKTQLGYYITEYLHAITKTISNFPSKKELYQLFQKDKEPIFYLDQSDRVEYYLDFKRYKAINADCADDKFNNITNLASLGFKKAYLVNETMLIEEVNLADLPEVVCIEGESGQLNNWIKREDLITSLLNAYKSKYEFLDSLNKTLPFSFTFFDKKGQLQYINFYNKYQANKVNKPQEPYSEQYLLDEQIKGTLCITYDPDILENILKKTDLYQELLMDMKVIFDNSWDVIYVTDSKGLTLRVSRACEFLWGLKKNRLVGKSVYDLEKEGVFKPSIARMVIENGHRITALQKTITGRTLLVVGNPVKDKHGKLVRVINTSRDITEQSQLQMELDRIREVSDRYKQELQQTKQFDSENIIFRSKEMSDVLDIAKKAAWADSTVLVTGETGVGKEVIASAIHNWSKRKGYSFISINCASIPENLLESELFGYQAGAFTGANQKGKVGMIELSHEGTLFLDEIGEMPLHLQAKLLRVIEDKSVIRLGGTEKMPIDMRVIASTNRDLNKEVQNNNFREDLFYRLNVIPVHIPPLRNRKDDIAPLVIYFLQKYNILNMKNVSFSKDVIDQLTCYPWSGNVRELQNLVERLVVITDKKVIEIDDLPQQIILGANHDITVNVGRVIPLSDAIEQLEMKLFERSLLEYSSTSEIASALGINQSTVSRKMQKLGLKPKGK